MPPEKAAATIVKMPAASTKSVRFCGILMVSCCVSSSGARDFPHLGQKVASS